MAKNKISKYEILEELGRGGMGVVYKVFAPHMDAFFALKMLTCTNVQLGVDRFIIEARAMAKLNHPHIVKIYDVGVENNIPFFTMRYIDGLSLKEFLKDASLDIRLFSQLMVKIGKAMTYAHEQGIIHRDLKPANIMLDKDQEPLVMDFGLAKFTQRDVSLSKTGTILGTPQYMSPQQARGEKVNELADVYALGAIFYEMLAGRAMVQGKDMADVLYKVVHREPQLLTATNNKLSKDLEIICSKAVAKDADSRYQSIAEFTEDIERFLHGEIIKAKAVSLWEKAYSKIQRNKLTIQIAIVFILFTILAIWFFAKRHSLEFYTLVAQADTWQKQVKKIPTVNKKMEVYFKISNLLEKALVLSSDVVIKNKLIVVQKKIALLAKKQKNYLLSFALLQQCKRLGDKQADTLLYDLEQIQKKHDRFIKKIMQKIKQKQVQSALLDRYVFTIVKMQKAYVIKILLPYLKNGSKNQRLLAIKALGKMGNNYTKYKDKDVVEHLLYSLEKYTSSEMIKKNQVELEEIVWTLGWLKDARANKPVYRLRKLAKFNYLFQDRTKIPYKWIPLNKILPKKAQHFFIRGDMKLEKGYLREAIIDYSKAIALSSKYRDAYNYRGNAYKELKEYQKAIIDYNKAIAISPGYWEPYNNRGSAYAGLKEYQKSIADYSKAIVLNSKYSAAYNNRGVVYNASKEYSKALTDFNQAISLNASYSVAYNNRGISYVGLKEYNKAIADFTQAITLDSKLADAYSNRGNAYRMLKKHPQALADFNKTIALNPRFLNAYYSMGLVYRTLKKYSLALANYNKAIALNPRDSNAYDSRGLVYKDLKEYQKAIVDYSKAIALAPKSLSAYNNRGLVYAILKEYHKAINDYGKAISLAPKNARIYNNRGRVYYHLKMYAKAIDDYNMAITLAPKLLESYNDRGNTFRMMQMYSKAIADYSKVISLNSKSFLTYANRGYLYMQLKQYKRAYRDFQMFLKLVPNHPMAPRIRIIVSKLKK